MGNYYFFSGNNSCPLVNASLNCFSRMTGKSRIQQEVLKLYRKLLRASRKKPGFEVTIKHEFHKNKSIPMGDILKIEFLMRNGEKKLEMLKDPHITSMGHFVENKEREGAM